MHTPSIIPPGAKNIPQLRVAAKDWAKLNKDIPAEEVEQIITAFIRDSSILKKCMGGILLGYMPAQRRMLAPGLYEKWLEYTVGWAAIDAICYGNFTAEEILGNFNAWQSSIKRLSKSDNINKRRGAMVLLTKPLKQSEDDRLSQLAFYLIDNAKEEKDILITKAISWLMRSLIKFHRKEVEIYIKQNKDTLPKIAIRETLNKLRTGKKSGVK